jgi:hypothetical protein
LDIENKGIQIKHKEDIDRLLGDLNKSFENIKKSDFYE